VYIHVSIKTKNITKSLAALKSDLALYLQQQPFVYSKALRRRVLLSKLPECLLNRKSTQKQRLQCFLLAMDILKHSKGYTLQYNTKHQKEFNIFGFSADNHEVHVHLREETSKTKDRRTYFVSCFYKKP
jgi:hypothetical protein